MKNIVSTYAEKFRQDRQKQLKLAAVLAALAVIVAGIVFWQLHSTGVAMSNEVYCGMEEHVHDDSCYEHVLICNSEDEDHVHDDSCYETVLVCDIPEHTHTVECLVDETADVETASVWEETLPALSGIWSQDVVSVAESQLGYTESEANYILADDGATHQGYNRYGAWYGNEYGDWDAMFASFCLNYAGVPEEEFPEASGAYAWTADLSNDDLYVDDEDFTPAAGDLVFFDGDLDGEADRVGVVVDTDDEEGTITVIEGDSNDAVEVNVYDSSDNMIMGFGLLPEQDLGGENMYTVEYDCDEPNYVEISGPESVLEDSDVTFYVTVDLDTGYDIAEATVNGEELLPASVTASEDEQIYTYKYTIENVDENLAVFLDAKQVINGSGTIGVYMKSTSNVYGLNPELELTVSNVPTNARISLDSPHITLKDQENGEDVVTTLKGSLYYLTNGGSAADEVQVSYLMLDEDTDKENVFVVTPYDGKGEAFDMKSGILILDSSQYVRAEFGIMPIQTNTLCSLDENDVYEQELIGAKEDASSEQIFEVVGYVGAPIRLFQITDKSEFYYGSLDEKLDENNDPIPDTIDLTECAFGVITEIEKDGEIGFTVLPTDEYGGEPIKDVNLYMVSDKVYSFDVVVGNVVNDHTEDNGDVYLWLGDTYYVDTYHNQGSTSNGYSNNSATYNSDKSMNWDVGVWAQLATEDYTYTDSNGNETVREARETAINNGNNSFSDYKTVPFSDIANYIHQGGTNQIDKTDANKYNYGIIGPYTVDNEVVTATSRVTGHIGDEFIASDAFGSETVYMVTDEEIITDWIDVGAHASDGGTRAWWYWINNYYKLNNYEDQLEYVEITQNKNGQVRLEADELGPAGTGSEFDLWDENVILLTKRESVIKSELTNKNNQETMEKAGKVTFNSNASLPHHIQIRLNAAVETVIDNEVYYGNLSVISSKDTTDTTLYPLVSYSIVATDGETYTGKKNVPLAADSNLETDIYYFGDASGSGIYVSRDDMYDPDQVQISISLNFTGTLTSKDGTKEFEYTLEKPLNYSVEKMTATQLKEAYDTCPNSAGYDFAVNLSAVLQEENRADDLTLYKIWEDDGDSYGSRDNIDSVTVTLERSTDGITYEDVPEIDEEGKDKPNTVKSFEIKPEPGDEDIWSLTVTSDDINLRYNVDDDNTAYYQFRIKNGSENIDEINEEDGFFTYSDSYSGLTVTNSLDQDFIIIEGIKEWKDAEGNTLDPETDSRIPESVNIAVYQDGEFYSMATVSEENDWKFTFDNLPKWRDLYSATEYVYTLGELESDGTPVSEDSVTLLGNDWYYVTVNETGSDGSTTTYTVTNTLVTTSLPVTGGTGTWLYTAAGACLIGGAAAALIYRKRRAVRS